MKSSREDKDLDEASLSLLDLPIELAYLVAEQASSYNDATRVMAALAPTCKQFGDHQWGFFGPALDKRASNQLGKYIEDADIVNVEAMVKANPRLLLCFIEKIVNPHTQQIIMGMTPLQAARCEGDDEMCLMLTPYFELACGGKEAGREEIRKQLNEKFGEGSDEHKESEEVRKNRLEKVLQAITNEKFNNGRDDATNKLILSKATQIAIARFRKEFAASQPKIIKSGRRFRLELLQEVCKTYAEAAAQWGQNYNKCALLEDAALSFVLNYVPANDVQRFSQGLHFLQDQGKKFKRASTTHDGHNYYSALTSASADFVLSGSYIDIVFGMGLSRSRAVAFAESHHRLCKTYVEQKLQTCRTYAATLARENVSVHSLLM